MDRAVGLSQHSQALPEEGDYVVAQDGGLAAKADDTFQSRGPAHGREIKGILQLGEEVTGEEGHSRHSTTPPDFHDRQIHLVALLLQEATDLAFLTRLRVQRAPVH